MYRKALDYLSDWLSLTDRKPLVIRGARQVGKTWLVRHFAKISSKTLIEINFEKKPSHALFFDSNEPEQILLHLSGVVGHAIDIENSLLFLDEIQSAPEILSKLRWFAEDCPRLPVIAAGSLLEFLLHKHSFSMPVGRISYLHLEPLSFEEFLLASDKKILHDYLQQFNFSNAIPLPTHEQFLSLFKEYIFVGGMPAAIASWISKRSLTEVSRKQHELITTYRDDFSRYRGRITLDRLDETFNAVPNWLGKKFILARVNESAQPASIKSSLELLNRARVCHRVSGCSANGVPLAAEKKEKYFKEIFVDVGLCSAALCLNFTKINSENELVLVNAGGIAEQVTGQLLRTINPFYIEPVLYYWVREEQGSNAEIDYIIQHGNKVIPVEVKAGSTGSLKSLHLFMELKKYQQAVRINSDLPTKTDVSVKNHVGKTVEYSLISIPFYLLSQITRLLNS